MKTDPIIAEVRKARRDILASYGWDFERMSRDAMRRQEQSVVPYAAPLAASRTDRGPLRVAEPRGEYRVRNARKPLQPQRKVTP